MKTADAILVVLLVAVTACAPKAVVAPVPNMDPGRVPPSPVETPPPPPKEPILPPSEAYRRGLMPLASTNVWAYRQAHPEYDGRGVLIGILDSGIDAGIGGLGLTSTGDSKLLDLRDFSGEGRVALTPLVAQGDTAVVAGISLGGIGRATTLARGGELWGGTILERPLGEPPANDLNGDGDDEDRLLLVVARASDGWVLFADTDGDGTLADERPVHDYLVAKETFGWTTGGQPTPMTVAVNFGASTTEPSLDLFFDNSGHGTHVAGIAAGSGLYGVAGFDGVAPGAQLLGLKISNNALGGISVTGAMVRAIGYAIRFAKERRLPLVLNLSFGVGNEREGSARIDAIIDSVLVANPELIFATSAGNDGPGLSTMGFPGSADRVISVGATIPPAFTGGPTVIGDVVAFFSARGGELAKPDILAPGIAYSSVPRWETGSESKNGTSMASPHVAGAMALILSGLVHERRRWTAAQVKQAVLATGRDMSGVMRADEGAGLLDVVAADRVLRRLPAIAAVRVRSAGLAGAGVMRFLTPGRAADTTVRVEIEGALGGPVHLTSNVGWLSTPTTIQLTPPSTGFDLTIKGSSVAGSATAAGAVVGWATDTSIGPLFRVPVTLATPFPLGDTGRRVRSNLGASNAFRFFFQAEEGRPFRATVGTSARGQEVLAFLHEPGGQPFRVENGQRGSFQEEAAVYDVDGRDVVRGAYEVVAVAPPSAGATVEIGVVQSPVTLAATRTTKDTITATVINQASRLVSGAAMLGYIGAERTLAFSQRGSTERRVTVRVPPWASRLVVDLGVGRDAWTQFTDLGLAVVDDAGRILANAPLNYSFGRAAADLGPALGGRDIVVVVAPAFAEPDATTLWDGRLSIRFYAETPRLVETAQPTDFSLAPGRSASFRYPATAFPWPLGDGFFPVAHFVTEIGGALWGREQPLPEPSGPIMR